MPDRRTRQRARKRRWPMISVGVLLVSTLAAALALNASRASRASLDEVDLARLRVSEAARVAADTPFELDAVISPDGRHIAYAVGEEGAMRLFVRRRDGGRAVAIAESVDGDQRRPRWSPDGASLAFQTADAVWVVPALGGNARRLVEAAPGGPPSITSPVWSPDGQDIAWVMGDSLFRMSATGGPRTLLARVPEGHSLAWSPDGKWLAAVSGNTAFTDGARTGFGRSGAGIGNLAPSAIVLIAVTADNASVTLRRDPGDSSGKTGPVQVLIPARELNVSPAWIGRHTLLFVSARGSTRDLFAARITDVGTLRDSVERLTAGLELHGVSSSADGEHLAYSVFRQAANVWSLPIRPDDPQTIRSAQRVTQGTQVVEGLDVSADGRWLAFDADVDGQQDIFRVPLLNGAPTTRDPERIVATPGDDFHPSWSPDARWIAFYSFRGGVRRAAYAPASGETVRLVHPNGPNLEEHSPVWSANGQQLVYFRWERGGINLFRVNRLTDTSWSTETRLTTTGGLAPSMSQDGRSFVYFSSDGTVRLAQGEPLETHARTILTPPGPSGRGLHVTSARITPDGQSLIVKAHDQTSSGFWLFPVMNGELKAPRVLVRFDDPHWTSPRPEFTTDGRHVYFTLAEREADVWVMRLDRK